MTEGTKILLKSNPSMFPNKPLIWLLYLFLIPVFGIGLIFFIIWRIQRHTEVLLITDKYVTLRKGLFNIREVQVYHSDISRLNINRTLWQRLTGIGDIEIGSSATDDIDIRAFGYNNPEEVRRIINGYR